MVIFLIMVVGYCYHEHLRTKDWMEKQMEFYHNRTWWWNKHPEEFEDDRIHFSH